MSDAHNEHESVIKTPKQLIIVVILAFLVPIIGIALLVSYIGNGTATTEGAGASLSPAEAANERIRPVAHVELKDASGPKVMKSGEEVYKAVCAACHDSGAAGAPKLGDAGAWAARLGAGYDGLLKAVLAGKGAMPARGGASPDDISDYEIGRAVVHLANASGGKLAEPAAPAAAAGGDEVKLGADAGKGVYEQVCAACHTSGVAGAPKFGDKAAWASLSKEGVPSLLGSVIKGKGVMPANGGSDKSEAEIRAAVEYMLDAAK